MNFLTLANLLRVATTTHKIIAALAAIAVITVGTVDYINSRKDQQ